MSDPSKPPLDESNRAALAAPGSIMLGGATYLLSPLLPADYAMLREHCRELALIDVQTPLAGIMADFEKMPPAMQALAMREAVAQAAGAKKPEPTNEAIAANSGTLAGVRFTFWLSARKLHPELTREKVAELVTDDNRFDVMGKQLEVEGQKPKAGDDPKAPGSAGS